MIIHYVVEKRHFCCYCLQAFNTEKTTKFHVKNCFITNGKQMIKMPRNMIMLDSKIMKEQ